MVQYDPRKRAIPSPRAHLARGRGGTLIFLFFLFIIYFFIVDITQSHLYTYYINNSKKNV